MDEERKANSAREARKTKLSTRRLRQRGVSTSLLRRSRVRLLGQKALSQRELILQAVRGPTRTSAFIRCMVGLSDLRGKSAGQTDRWEQRAVSLNFAGELLPDADYHALNAPAAPLPTKCNKLPLVLRRGVSSRPRLADRRSRSASGRCVGRSVSDGPGRTSERGWRASGSGTRCPPRHDG